MSSTNPASTTGERLDQSTLASDLGFLLARANAIALAGSHAALAEHGLKVRSYSVLAITAENLRPSQRELASFLRLDPSQIVAIVDDLQARGLVVRQPDPADRRTNVVVATEKGRAVHALAREAMRAAELRAHVALTTSQREQLGGMLRRLAFPD